MWDGVVREEMGGPVVREGFFALSAVLGWCLSRQASPIRQELWEESLWSDPDHLDVNDRLVSIISLWSLYHLE